MSKTKNISIIKIKKFNKEIVSQTNIVFNIDLFNLTLRELLKTEISKKYKMKIFIAQMKMKKFQIY